MDKAIVNGLTIKQAIGACALPGLVPTTSTLYSRVQTTRQRGTYGDFHIKRSWQEKRKLDMVINITADNISPMTISTTLSSTASTVSVSQSYKRTRRSSKQASE